MRRTPLVYQVPRANPGCLFTSTERLRRAPSQGAVASKRGGTRARVQEAVSWRV